MWERFSYYGMRALLVLFMVDAVKHGGLGLTDQLATATYGLYTAAAYLAALPGGWIADRFLGAKRSVWYGGITIACGHFTLAIPRIECFYLGLLLVVVGTGLLKPNVSALVGSLYPEGGARRDAGFTVFYMGINLGAGLGPLVCSALGEKVNWHYGFAAAGVGMTLGLAQYRLMAKHLGEAGAKPRHQEGLRRRDWFPLLAGGVALLLLLSLLLSGLIRLDPIWLAGAATNFIVGVAILYFIFVFLFLRLEPVEKKRVAVIAVLFVASAIFWSGFEQAGSSLNLFADRHTERVLFNFTIPAGWFQTLEPVFVISLAPVLAALWIRLGARNLNPSVPLKFSFGLLLLGAGFFVMWGAALWVARGQKVWPQWLLMTYLLHSLAELCVSPVGLSSVTKLAPPRLVGQMLGTWFLATSLGNLLAGQMAGRFSANGVQDMPARYLFIVLTTAGAGLLLLVIIRPLKKLMAGVE
jgi:POT family proton-dependent oligopeptide transporter